MMVVRAGSVAFHFDGVINGSTDFVEASDIEDRPIEGMRELMRKLSSAGFSISIYSTRAAVLSGRKAIIAWLARHGMLDFFSEVTSSSPSTGCVVDERAISFKGTCDVQSMFWQIVNFGKEHWDGEGQY